MGDPLLPRLAARVTWQRLPLGLLVLASATVLLLHALAALAPEGPRRAARAELTRHAELRARVQALVPWAERIAARAWVRALTPESAGWPALLAAHTRRLDAAQAGALAALRDELDAGLWWSAERLARQAAVAWLLRAPIALDEERIAALCARVERLEQELAGRAAQLEADLQAARRPELLTELVPLANAARATWPQAGHLPLIDALVRLRLALAEAERLGRDTAELRLQASAGLITAAVAERIEGLGQQAADLRAAVRADEHALRDLVAQLEVTWEDALLRIDASSDGQAGPAAWLLTIRVAPGSAGAPAHPELRLRQVALDPHERARLAPLVGLAIRSKPLGRYDHEASGLAIPIGFSWLTDASVRSNRYGYWDGPGPTARWAWWPAYAALAEVFWDQRQAPTREQVSAFSARRGSVFLGPDPRAPLYGPAGSVSQPWLRRQLADPAPPGREALEPVPRGAGGD